MAYQISEVLAQDLIPATQPPATSSDQFDEITFVLVESEIGLLKLIQDVKNFTVFIVNTERNRLDCTAPDWKHRISKYYPNKEAFELFKKDFSDCDSSSKPIKSDCYSSSKTIKIDQLSINQLNRLNNLFISNSLTQQDLPGLLLLCEKFKKLEKQKQKQLVEPSESDVKSNNLPSTHSIESKILSPTLNSNPGQLTIERNNFEDNITTKKTPTKSFQSNNFILKFMANHPKVTLLVTGVIIVAGIAAALMAFGVVEPHSIFKKLIDSLHKCKLSTSQANNLVGSIGAGVGFLSALGFSYAGYSLCKHMSGEQESSKILSIDQHIYIASSHK